MSAFTIDFTVPRFDSLPASGDFCHLLIGFANRLDPAGKELNKCPQGGVSRDTKTQDNIMYIFVVNLNF